MKTKPLLTSTSRTLNSQVRPQVGQWGSASRTIHPLTWGFPKELGRNVRLVDSRTDTSERCHPRTTPNPSGAKPERCQTRTALHIRAHIPVLLPRLCFRRAWGVGGGAEIVFGVVWVGVGGCCATPFVLSVGLGGGWWHRDHIWGSSGDGRVEFENPQTTIPSHIRAPEISGNSDTAASTSPRPYPSG